MVQIYIEPVCRFQKKTVKEYNHEMKTNSHTSYNLATYMFPYVVIEWREDVRGTTFELYDILLQTGGNVFTALLDTTKSQR